VIRNQSVPPSTVIPQVAYPDVRRAAAWLCDAFGFRVRLFVGNHRVQMHIGMGRWSSQNRRILTLRGAARCL
jgi:hypothetical protein